MRALRSVGGLLILGACACSSEDVTCIGVNGTQPCKSEKLADESLGQRLQALTADLSPGAIGNDVRTVQEYFATSGYFPDARLRKYYRWWRPVLDDSPQLGIFDQLTEDAVLRFQRRTGLPETGNVDTATRASMRQPSCGVPESALMDSGDREKYMFDDAIDGIIDTWPKRDLTWFVLNTDDGLSLSAVQGAVSAAFSSWSSNAPLRFSMATSAAAADIKITWVFDDQLSSAGRGKPAESLRPEDGGDISLNNCQLSTGGQACTFTWVISTAPTGNQVDVQSFVAHEIGHALGLQHSRANASKMVRQLPGAFTDRTGGVINLDMDDKIGIGLLYPDWTFFTDGAATAIDVGGTAASPSIWILGQSHSTGGYRVYQRIGSSWVFSKDTLGQSDGFTAYRIAVDPTGVPYAIQEGGAIFRRTTNTAQSGSWSPVASGTCAADIDVGFDGSVWVVDCASAGIRKLSGNTFGSPIGSSVSRIGVDASGTPWVVFFNHNIARLQNGSLQTVAGGGVNVDGGPTSTFGFNPGTPIGYPHLFGTHQVNGNYDTYVWRDTLGADTDRGGTQPSNWYYLAGAGGDISIGPDGFAWIIASDHTIYRQRRTF